MKFNIYLILFSLCITLNYQCKKNPAGINTPDPVNDQEQILFIRNDSMYNDICTIKPDGSEIKIIARYKAINGNIQRYQIARWSPDKTKLVVQGGPGSTLEYWPLWLMNNKGNLLKQISWNGYMPVWSSDGEAIFYTRRRGYFSLINDIFKYNLRTSAEDTILFAETGEPGTNSGFIYQLLDVFPYNTNKLLLNETYTYQDSSGRQTDDDSEIIIFDYLNDIKQYLTNNSLNEGWAKISQDKNLIAYSIKNKHPYHYTNDICLMNVNGDSLLQITDDLKSFFYLFFTWSFDAKKIALSRAVQYQSTGFNSYFDLVIIDIKTNSIVNITNNAQFKINNHVMDWK